MPTPREVIDALMQACTGVEGCYLYARDVRGGHPPALQGTYRADDAGGWEDEQPDLDMEVDGWLNLRIFLEKLGVKVT